MNYSVGHFNILRCIIWLCFFFYECFTRRTTSKIMFFQVLRSNICQKVVLINVQFLIRKVGQVLTFELILCGYFLGIPKHDFTLASIVWKFYIVKGKKGR